MKFFIIGAENEIGSEIIPQIRSQGHDVWAIVSTSESMQQVQRRGAIAFIGNPAENGRWMEYIPADLDAIINVSIPPIAHHLTLKSIENDIAPQLLQTAKNITYLAEKRQVKRIYQLCSGFFYKSLGDTPLSERSARDADPRTYGIAEKSLISHLLSKKEVNTTLLITGHYMYTSLGKTIPEIPLLMNRSLVQCGSGENYIQLTHIEDVIGAIVHLTGQFSNEHIINISDNKAIPQKEFLHLLSQIRTSHPLSLPSPITSIILGDAYTNSISTSLILRNDKLKESGYWLKFPDYSAGFAKLFH